MCVCVYVEEKDSDNESNLCMYIYISNILISCAIPPLQIPESAERAVDVDMSTTRVPEFHGSSDLGQPCFR